MDFHAESVCSSVIVFGCDSECLSIKHSRSVKQRIIVCFVHIS